MLYRLDAFLIDEVAQPLTDLAAKILNLNKINFAKIIYLFGNIVQFSGFLYWPRTQPDVFFIQVILGTMGPSIFVYYAIKKAEKRLSASESVEDLSLFLYRHWMLAVNMIFVSWLFITPSLRFASLDIFNVSMQLVLLILCCKEPTIKQRKKVMSTYVGLAIKAP
jgi:hypothetical protein